MHVPTPPTLPHSPLTHTPGRLLYRALLCHTPRLPIPPQHKSIAAFHIRREFRKNLNLQGRGLRDKLIAAYADEALMRSCIIAPCKETTSQIITRLEGLDGGFRALQARSQLSKHIVPPPGRPAPPTRKSKLRELALTPREKAERSALVRRRPPTLHATNGFPVIVWPGRRQSAKISTVLRCKIRRKIQAVQLWKYMEDEGLQLCKYEDAWDEQLWRMGIGGKRMSGDEVEPSWHDQGQRTWKSLKEKNNRLEAKTMKMTTRLQKVVEKATARYEEWKKERARLKRWAASQRRLYQGAVKEGTEDIGLQPQDIDIQELIPKEPKPKPKIKGPGPAEGWKRWRDARKYVPKQKRVQEGHELWDKWVAERRRIRAERRARNIALRETRLAREHRARCRAGIKAKKAKASKSE